MEKVALRTDCPYTRRWRIALIPQSLQKAIAYIRVSTTGQVTDGVSLEAQRARIQSWCSLHDYELLEVKVDAGLSGGRADNRPGLQAAIDLACRQKAALVVYSLSRLGRSTTDVLAIANRLEKCGADLVSLSEKIDTTSAAGKMVFRLLAVLSEFERDLIIERTTAAMSHLRSQGRRISRHVPFGYSLAEDGKHLVSVEAEQQVVQEIKRLRETNLSYATIAAKLNQSSINSKNGGRWHAKTVRDIVLRAA